MNDQDDIEQLAGVLLSDGIAVVRTDTIYGVLGLARSRTAVEKVYSVKKRDPRKQNIVLVSDFSQVGACSYAMKRIVDNSNRPVSVVLPAQDEEEWLLRGGDTVAYRLVNDPFLKAVIDMTGPVVAPSANPEGFPPARNITQAKDYFGDAIDIYVDGGTVPADTPPSRIVRLMPDGSILEVRS